MRVEATCCSPNQACTSRTRRAPSYSYCRPIIPRMLQWISLPTIRHLNTLEKVAPETHSTSDLAEGAVDPNWFARARVRRAHAACVAGSHITPPTWKTAGA